MIKDLSSLDLEVVKKEVPNLNSLEDIYNWKTYNPIGCSRCENTGYASRVAIGEAININDTIAKLISENSQDLNIETIKENQTFISLVQDGAMKVLRGTTTLEEVLRVIEV